MVTKKRDTNKIETKIGIDYKGDLLQCMLLMTMDYIKLQVKILFSFLSQRRIHTS
jgi:hypothetical protein